ncbi:MAG: hypothetical protein ACLFSZ_10725 [Puniceicoccaceae bacterium]
MIEKKFKSLVGSFLLGEISPAETEWMVEDLREKRERRDLFIEQVEEYLERCSSGVADPCAEHLRELLLKDLSRVGVRDVERATPRQRRPIPAREIEEHRQRPETGWELDEGSARDRKRVFSGGNQPVEEPRVLGADRSYVLPVLGILIMVATFVFMVRFSSLETRDEEQEDPGDPISAAIREGLSDSEAVRRANEFLEERSEEAETAEEESGGDAAAGPLDPVMAPPVSLAELIGLPKGGAGSSPGVSAGVDDGFLIRVPADEEVITDSDLESPVTDP